MEARTIFYTITKLVAFLFEDRDPFFTYILILFLKDITGGGVISGGKTFLRKKIV